jgi:hypothetical protein
MVEVSYHCPYCGAVTAVDREGYLNDKCVTREPLDDWTYASTTEDFETADGIELVCLGNVDRPPEAESADTTAAEDTAGGANDPNPDRDGCGRTYYLSFVKYDDGEAVDHREPNIDRPRFDFRP